MKTMKTKLFLVLALLFCAGTSFAQSYTKTAFTNKFVDTLTSRTDTSVTFLVGGTPTVNIITTAQNADSVKLVVDIDILLNEAWFNNVATATLALGHPSLHTPQSTYGQSNTLVVRDMSRIADLLQGATKMRIRNVITGAGFAPMSNQNYTQVVILQNK